MSKFEVPPLWGVPTGSGFHEVSWPGAFCFQRFQAVSLTRAAADAAEGHPDMPSDEEVNAAAKVFCVGVWNGFDPVSMMPTEQFDRFWGDGEGHQLHLTIARHALTAASAASGVAAEAEALANRQADMAAKERREARLAILAAIAIIGIIVAHVVIHR